MLKASPYHESLSYFKDHIDTHVLVQSTARGERDPYFIVVPKSLVFLGLYLGEVTIDELELQQPPLTDGGQRRIRSYH